jgi:glycosyltransferase involved in cell wall biosynthesis
MDKQAILDAIRNAKPAEGELEKVKVEIEVNSEKHQPMKKTQRLMTEYRATPTIEKLDELIDQMYQYYDTQGIEHLLRQLEKRVAQDKKNKPSRNAKWVGSPYERVMKSARLKMAKIKERKVTISACMIVKDEAYLITDRVGKSKHMNIRSCIASFINQVDELIICDTGSTDNTIKVIEKLADRYKGKIKLYHDKWVDFAHNRNLSVERATKDYILIIDADERLVCKTSLKRIIKHGNENGLDGFKLVFQDWKYGEYRVTGTTNYRLIPKKNIHICDPIHNQINGVHKAAVSQEAIIEHHGYIENKRRQEKITHTLKECLKEAKTWKGKSDLKYAHALMKAGEAYHNKRNYTMSFPLFKEADKYSNSLNAPMKLMLWWYLVQSYQLFGYSTAACIVAERMVKVDNKHIDAYMAMSNIHYNGKHYMTAGKYAHAWWQANNNKVIKDEVLYKTELSYEQATRVLIDCIAKGYDYKALNDVDFTKKHTEELYSPLFNILVANKDGALLGKVSLAFYEHYKQPNIAANIIGLMAQGVIENNPQLVDIVLNNHSIVSIVWRNAVVYFDVFDNLERKTYCQAQVERLSDVNIQSISKEGSPAGQ